MPIKVAWYNPEKTILKGEISGAWTWEEFHLSIDETHQLLKDVSHPVVIINVRMPDAKNPKGNPLPHYSRATKQMPEHQVMTINVSRDKPLNRMIANILGKLFPFMPAKFYIADNLDEALAYANKTLTEANQTASSTST